MCTVFWRCASVLVGLALLTAPASASADYCEGEDIGITAATAEQAEVVQLCLINVHRATSGLSALTLDPGLRAAARGHSRWMDDNDSFCHYPDPNAEPPVQCDGSPDSRAAAAGYPYPTGENIAWTDVPGRTSRQMFELWRNSPGHNSNMLFFDYATAGVGFVTGNHGVIGTQQFGTSPHTGTDTAVGLLRRSTCPAASAAVAGAETSVERAKRKVKEADTRRERRRARRRLGKARRELAAAEAAERAQCEVTSYAGSSLSPL